MKRLGDILVESGFLNATELAEVLSTQKETGKRLGEVMKVGSAPGARQGRGEPGRHRAGEKQND